MEALVTQINTLIEGIEHGEFGNPNDPEFKTAQSSLIILNKILEQNNIELLGNFMETLSEFIELWCSSEEMQDERTHKLSRMLGDDFDLNLGEFSDD